MLTEVRVCEYEGRLEELAKKYSDKFIHAEFGVVNKYCLMINEENEIYLLMISKNEPSPQILVSVMGTKQEKVGELLQDFENKIGIQLEKSPFHEKLFEGLEKILKDKTAN